MSSNIIPFPTKKLSEKETNEKAKMDLLKVLDIPCDQCGESLCDGWCNEQ